MSFLFRQLLRNQSTPINTALKSSFQIARASPTYLSTTVHSTQRTFSTTTIIKMSHEYKLTFDSLPAKNGDKVEAGVEGLEGAKVLLLKTEDSLRALGAHCTHYGAPLVKGVITEDGRITCPWHGACFSTATGDIENAPALDPLTTYPVRIEGNNVYVTAKEEELKHGSRTPNVKCQIKEADNVLIIGGGSGALGAIEELREKGYTGKVTVLSKEAYLPIDRTKLSKALLTDKAKITWRPEEFFKDASVEFHTNAEVENVDFVGHTVTTKDGKKWTYNKAIFATGGVPKRLPMPGFKELGNVFVLRDIFDAEKILAASGEGKKVIIVGSSFIGLELANCLAGKKCDVTVIGQESAPLERVLGEKVGKIVQNILENKSGIKFKLNVGVEDAKPSAGDSTKVGSVALKGGESVEADFVVLGVGVAPATEYLKNSGIKLEEDGSVSVDNHWRIEGVEDAYAVGDIATYPYPYSSENQKVRIEHWNVAQNAGRSAALHIATGRKPAAFIPIFWSALGLQLRYCGHSSQTLEPYDDVIIQGEVEKNKFVAYYTKGEKVVAVASMQMDPKVVQSAELMRRRKMLSKKELLEGGDVLSVYPPKGVRVEA